MIKQNHYLRLCAVSLLLAGVATQLQAQDLYKSRAEMLNAEAASKQADAALIHAAADYEKAAAEAAKLRQEIREKAANNDYLETEVFYKKRAQYHTYHESRDAARQAARAKTEPVKNVNRAVSTKIVTQAASGKPGEVIWPTIFKAAAFDPTRRNIDALLASRTPEDSGVGSLNCVSILSGLDDLKTTLRKNIYRYSSHDYLAARRFLEMLAEEVKMPVLEVPETIDRVARN
jgi:hypothetical protein